MNPLISILVQVKDTNDSWELNLSRVPVVGELIRIGKTIYTAKQVIHTPCDENHPAKLFVSRTRAAGPDD
jgi:hypothetical protein